MENLFLGLTTDTKSSSAMLDESKIEFVIDGEALIELCENGKILIRGKEVENDKLVVEAMRKFLKHNGFLGYDNG